MSSESGLKDGAILAAHNDNNADGMVKVRKCPICDEPAVFEARPFCSKRCADVDLGRWMTGRYAIPVEDDEDEDGEQGIEAPSDS